MKKPTHIIEGCGLGLAAIAALGILGVWWWVKSFLDGIPMSESARTRSHLEAQQALAASHDADRWLPFTTGAHEFAVVAFWMAIGVLALGLSVGFVVGRARRSRWVWARDGILPVPAGTLSRHPQYALETIGAHHQAEIANAKRPLPPAHYHVAAGAKEPAEAAPKDEHHEAPEFGELWKRGEFAANGGT